MVSSFVAKNLICVHRLPVRSRPGNVPKKGNYRGLKEGAAPVSFLSSPPEVPKRCRGSVEIINARGQMNYRAYAPRLLLFEQNISHDRW